MAQCRPNPQTHHTTAKERLFTLLGQVDAAIADALPGVAPALTRELVDLSVACHDAAKRLRVPPVEVSRSAG